MNVRSSGGNDQGQQKDHNGACSSKDYFYKNESRLLCLMLFFSGSKVIKQMGFCGMSHDVFHINKRHGLLEECVKSSRKKQKQEHVMLPEVCVKRKDKSSRSNVSICWNRVSCGIKVDNFGGV